MKNNLYATQKPHVALEPLQEQILSKFIQDNYGSWVPLLYVVTLLMEFSSAGHSLVGLYNFLIWALEVNEGVRNVDTDLAIMETIRHDLQHMHERFFSPRSASYKNMDEP